jgi:hypothetical protein
VKRRDTDERRWTPSSWNKTRITENYGQILESGYGNTPPACVTKKYEEIREKKWEHEAALQRKEVQRRLQQERSVAFVMLMH